jgi:hypothetical protein
VLSGTFDMGRAITAISGTAAALLPRPFGQIAPTLASFWDLVTRDLNKAYRPELHYMRGPGPAWHAKNGSPNPTA